VIASSIVIEDAKVSSAESRSPPPVYFYCSRNTAEPERSNTTEILACIARQLSSQYPGGPLLSPTLKVREKKVSEGASKKANLGLKDIRRLIVELTEQYKLTTIVIDALDECNLETRGDLIEALGIVLHDSTSSVKVFVSSRDDGDLRYGLGDHPSIHVTSKINRTDIQAFVNTQTDQLVAKNRLLAHVKAKITKDELKTLIKANVIRGADGM
jgi:hypothetical protein